MVSAGLNTVVMGCGCFVFLGGGISRVDKVLAHNDMEMALLFKRGKRKLVFTPEKGAGDSREEEIFFLLYSA